jgi:DNA-binding GntR family transcriptional regulator
MTPSSGGGSIGDKLYVQLRDAVVTGALPPNRRIVEGDIARRYEVSRTPVREALHHLVLNGLVRPTSRGLVVAEFSAEELANFCAVRDALEALAARQAAAARSELDVLALKDLLDRFEQAIGGDVEQLIELNHDFHDVVWEAARNPFLARQLAVVRSLIERLDSTTLSTEERQREALEEHRAILAALRDRDEEGAGRAAGEHFRRATAIRLLAKRRRRRGSESA